MTDPVIVGSEIKIIRTATTIPKTLSRNYSGSGTYNALWYEGAAYVVPAGKKFICTSVTCATSQDTTGFCYIHKHTVADAAGGTLIVNLVGTFNTTAADYAIGLTMPFYYEVEAGKYLNGYMQGAGYQLVSVTGVEVDV